MPFHRLTRRQHQIADMICLDGMTVVAIAQRLEMPIATARAHVRGIAQRLSNPHGLPAYRLIQSYSAARKLAVADELNAQRSAVA